MTTINWLANVTVMIGVVALMSSPASPAPKKGFIANIEALTENNKDFRRVLYTGKRLQLVLMACPSIAAPEKSRLS